MAHPFKSLLAVALAAAVTIVAADRAFAPVVNLPPAEYETRVAIDDYAAADPQVLVLGSSYARSLLPVAAHYAAQPAPLRVAVVPIEGGKMTAYDWLLQHRLAPLMLETDDRGQRLRPSLRELVLVSNYWDACGRSAPYPNLPARAWGLQDYLADLVRHGHNSYNNNYLDARWTELLHDSTLVRDRDFARIVPRFRERLRPRAAEDLAQSQAARLQTWFQMIEATDVARADTCQTAQQEAAYRNILEFARQQNLRVTMLLWPGIPLSRRPSTDAVNTRYRAWVDAIHGPASAVQVIDLTQLVPLADADYRSDLDHLKPSGDAKIEAWAVNGLFREIADRLAGGQP